MRIKNHIPWREQLDLLEIEGINDEEGFDDLLESMDEGGSGAGFPRTPVRRVNTPTANFRRGSDSDASSNWDAEFGAAQTHARNLLANLGNK